MKKLIVFLFILLIPVAFSGCATWFSVDNTGFNVKKENARMSALIDLYIHNYNHNDSSVNTSSAGGKTPALKKSSANKPLLFRISERKTPPLLPPELKKPKLKVKMQVVNQARIVGNQSGLPVVAVNYVNKPLWNILQDISNQTGYVFSTPGNNLAKTYNLAGRFNLAELLSKLFVNDKTTVNVKTKRIKIWR